MRRRVRVAFTAAFCTATYLVLASTSLWRRARTIEVVVSHYDESPDVLARTIHEVRQRLSPRRTIVYTKGEGEVRLAGVDTVRQTVNEFWRARKGSDRGVDYFWMDALLRRLLASSYAVASVWRRASYVSCEDEYSSHWLNKEGRLLSPISTRDKRLLKEHQPRVMKLSHKGGVPRRGPFSRRFKRSGIWHVLEEFG
jgi:hypothetical protein